MRWDLHFVSHLTQKKKKKRTKVLVLVNEPSFLSFYVLPFVLQPPLLILTCPDQPVTVADMPINLIYSGIFHTELNFIRIQTTLGII
jgi:hypothetical protein